MPSVGRLIAENIFTFEKLDVNFNQPGMNLVLGNNMDDITGNNSRNGVGKTNLMRALEVALQGASSGYKATDYIRDDAGKNMLAVLEFTPHGEPVHHAYQYNKYGSWGSGLSIYRGGTYEQFEEGVEGVEDVSPDGSREAAIELAERFGLTIDEWRVLASLVNNDNDLFDPFFDTRRAGRLELVQSMFGMDYSKILEKNKQELTALNARWNTLSNGISASNGILRAQLEALGDKEQLAARLEELKKASETDEAALAQIRKEIEPFLQIEQTLARYNELNEAVGKYATDMQADYDRANTEITTIQTRLADIQHQYARLQRIEELARELDSASVKLARLGTRFVDMSPEQCDEHVRVTRNSRDALAKVVALATEHRQAFDYIRENISVVDWAGLAEAKEAVGGWIAQSQDYIAALEANIASNDEQADSHRAMLKKQRELVNIFKRIAELGFAEPANLNAYADGSELARYKSELAVLDSNIQRENAAYDSFEKALASGEGGKCMHCGSELDVAHIQGELERLAQVITGLNEQRNPLLHYQQVANELRILASDPVFVELGYTYWPGYVEDQLNSTIAGLEGYISEYETQTATLKQQVAQYNESLPGYRWLANTIDTLLNHPEDVVNAAWIFNGEADVPTMDADIQATTAAAAALRVIQQLETEQDALIRKGDGDLKSSNDCIQERNAKQARMQELQTFTRWAATNLPLWNELHSDKFANREQLSSGDAVASLVSLRRREEALEVSVKASVREIASLENNLGTIKDLEARLSAVADQEEELKVVEQAIETKKAITYLAGPQGLIVNRTERLFEHLNNLMNLYLKMMVQDGANNVGKRLTAYLEMSSSSVELEAYRGDKNVSKNTLSRSEKARLKLARTLAFRELAPPSKLPNVLLIDELDGSSCPVNTGRIWDAVRHHVERVPSTCVWAISHSPEVQAQSYWTSIYEVQKQNSIATLRQVR